MRPSELRPASRQREIWCSWTRCRARTNAAFIARLVVVARSGAMQARSTRAAMHRQEAPQDQVLPESIVKIGYDHRR